MNKRFIGRENLDNNAQIEDNNSSSERRRILHIEVLRIIAAFFVIYNHTGLNGFLLFSSFGPQQIRYWVYLFFSVCCKISVPIFLMISGALLLNRDESKKSLIMRAVRIIIALVLFSGLSYFQQIYFGAEVFDLKRFIYVFVTDTWMSPFWYLYSYIGFLLTLPLLRKIAVGFSVGDYKYMIALVLTIHGLLPPLMYVLSAGDVTVNRNFNVAWVATQIFFYPLLGFFLERRLNIEKITRKWFSIFWLINICSMIATCYVSHMEYLISGEFRQSFLMAFVPINASCLYLTLSKGMRSRKMKPTSILLIKEIGRCTFGIYLFHGLLLRSEIGIIKYCTTLNNIPLIKISLHCLEIMIIGGLITFLLRKIPIVREIM